MRSLTRGDGNLRLQQPGFRLLRIAANQKYFLHGPRPRVKALQPRVRRILHLKVRRCLSAANLDAAWHNSADVRAITHDTVKDRIESANPAMLSFDAAELHCRIIRGNHEVTRGLVTREMTVAN